MKTIDCKQYTAEWWDTRKGIPTASNFGRIVTPKQWKPATGRWSYLCELIADYYNPHYGQHEQYVSDAMAHGSYTEPEARRYYEFTKGVVVDEVGFCVEDKGRYGCSPDGLVGDDGACEFKAPDLKTHVGWLLDNCVPDKYLPQCHGVLLVTGRKWIDFMSYCPPLPNVVHRVEPSDKTEKLAAYLEDFCEELSSAYADIAEHGELKVLPRAKEVAIF